MKITKWNLVYFSPTGSTKKVLKTIARTYNKKVDEYDSTNYKNKEGMLQFTNSDFVIFGVPVYSGRVPETAISRLLHYRGTNTPAAIVVTYGNREYDDALIELKTILETKGFRVIAAAAFVAEHSIVPSIAAGRPLKNDLAIAESFAAKLSKKLNEIHSPNEIPVTVKGNKEYRKYKTIPIHPHTTSACTKCSTCVKLCPVKAISPGDPYKTDKKKCVTCMRCTAVCPKKARKFYPIEAWIAKMTIAGKCKTVKQPEIFI